LCSDLLKIFFVWERGSVSYGVVSNRLCLVSPTTPALLWPQRFEAIQKFSLWTKHWPVPYGQNISRFVNQGAEQACCTLFYTDLLPASLVGFVQPNDIDIHSHESTQVLAMNLLKY